MIVPIILLCVYQLHFDKPMYDKVRSETLDLMYQTRIKDKVLTEFEYTKLSYEFLGFMLPFRLFIEFSKRMLVPIVVVMILLSNFT